MCVYFYASKIFKTHDFNFHKESSEIIKMANDGIMFIGFNQDSECFMCGLEDGYRIYNTDPLKENAREDEGGVKHVEMLYRCNYVGIVGGGKNPKYPRNKAIVWDDYQKKVAISLEFKIEVFSIKLRRDRIAVVFEKFIKVYSFSQTPQFMHVFDTYPNANGLCCLCSHSTNSYLAYPSDKKPGWVEIVDLFNTEKPSVKIEAHDNPITCMAMSNDGTKMATASTKGTLIRVFETEGGTLLHELRRGANTTKLCVSSDHGTVHVFILDSPEKNSRSSLANATFLPKYFQSKWSSFKFEVNNHSKFICAFSQNLDQHSIIALCSDGTYYKYLLDNANDTKSCQLESCTKFLELTSR
ncbi:WD repeat domain phosphoinositide-interacting 3 [Brachionus plicatilis]|uniref:WD repeat domain phosphoinositide-interacting 3 n=1 Tax=Brachionus plicatilis TaxID=10195 RepID=A0A3M7T2U5_BRAPC|nr:WD repeat domain phosphoinositide-interacting 3 [Brachionus plicatilis]